METLYTGRLHGFPNLTAGYYSSIPDEGVLSLIVVLATSVSLVALVFAFITYSLFSDLRNLMGTTLMTLLATTFMAQLIYVIGVGGVHEKGLCLSIAHSLEFLHLCLIAWLAVLCRDTHNALTVEQPTLHSREMCCKYAASCLFGWGGPAIAVSLAYTLDTAATSDMVKSNCWFIEKKLYLLTYSFPSMVLLSACVCLMVRSWVRLKYTLSLETRPKQKTKLAKAKKLQVGLCSKLTATILTMELAGLGYVTTGLSGFWLVYNVLHAVQGLIMALCATCNSQVLSVYTRRHRRRRSSQRLLSQSSSIDDLEWRPLPSTV
ncbi:uncharacterized protein LOC106670892 isoform X2 [Cimex lectularius]|uniref:G-protein coupled receptors family 2 profile 2 domain-containing protein n=1 Tax=Cimex lectularius TaxID=79782 RepID=A0A8I6S763_CIMLE|nr:uncharacterized protein LOC106670892 isoform X2 [Cimex lectularius]